MPGLAIPVPGGAARPGLCTDCGVSRMSDPKACGRACQFIRPDYPGLETATHGRPADPARGDEAHFGVTLAMHRARLAPPAHGAQWSGLTTAIAAEALASGRVDAVLAMTADPEDRWRPRPAIVTDPEAMAACRGMRMGYAPLLALVEPAIAAGHRRLAVVAIPCQTYALRVLEARLALDRLYVIGTPCSDNTTTEKFHAFLAALDDRPDGIAYLEFCPDYRVEIRYDDGRPTRRVPFLDLPLADLPADFFPLTCRTCVDYTNRLADITVGYMGGHGSCSDAPGAQWVIVRNTRGAELLDALGPRLERLAPVDCGRRRSAVEGFMTNAARAAGGLPLRRLPRWLRPLVSWAQPRFGPRGLEFARARVEMKAIEAVLGLRRAHPRRLKSMVPDHVWRLVAPYGLAPGEGERPAPVPAIRDRRPGGPTAEALPDATPAPPPR
ncbi:MAG: Coenzyme F420 hydrogenase/dehydrogenase, beta subunit C-terminal domain [Pseudomonadota bacterium]